MIEQEHPKISVIVPCHNIEEFINTCLTSLSQQTYGDFEVICIDDGSTDATGQLLEQYAASDARFRVIHQEHTGPSGARNAGVAASSAPLIAFVDGDDYAAPQYLAILEGLLTHYRADMACCSHKNARPGSTITFESEPDAASQAIQQARVLDSSETLREIAEENIHFSYWSKLMTRELAEAAPFPEGMVYEDIWNLGLTTAAARRVVFSPIPLYCYVARDSSVTRARPQPLKRFWQFREATDKFEAIYRETRGLINATDDSSYCLHLVHRLCGQYATLQNSICDDTVCSEIANALLDELRATYQLACLRGVSRLHPQMIRAILLLHAPAVHDIALDTYRQLTNR